MDTHSAAFLFVLKMTANLELFHKFEKSIFDLSGKCFKTKPRKNEAISKFWMQILLDVMNLKQFPNWRAPVNKLIVIFEGKKAVRQTISMIHF